MTDYLKWAEFMSLCLTPIVLGSTMVVLMIFGPHISRMIFSKDRLGPTQLLIAGIVIGFLGKLCDNAYWSVPWMGSYLGNHHASWWFSHGIIANIPFRQISTIVSAWCHILAAWRMMESSKVSLMGAGVFATIVSILYVWCVCEYLSN